MENISIFMCQYLSESIYFELPDKLKIWIKGLIKIKSNDNKCFLWCHIRHLNSSIKNPQRITKVDKRMVNYLDYKGIKFPISEKRL